MARTMTSTVDELLEAEAKLWSHGMSYLKSMAVQSAIKLGIPKALHGLGGVASLSELHAAVPVAATKGPCLSRLLRFLAASGILQEETTPHGPVYRETTASRLLVDDGAGPCLSPFVFMMPSPLYMTASHGLADWLGKDEAGDTPFSVAHGEGIYGFVGRDASFRDIFEKAMVSDSSFMADLIVHACTNTQVLAGVTSLVDVGGGTGTTAKAIAKAFPHVKCSVLELPYVVDAALAADSDGSVDFVGGNMMEYIPPADVVFFKVVLHNWSDEDCIRILKRAKEAISMQEPKGKVIIVDTVVGYPSKQASEPQLLLDLCMMVMTTGMQREEEKWHGIFLAAGFTRYKIVAALGIRSLIELYP